MKKIEKNSKKVLLVEDDVDILEILVEKFELLGFQVVSADNGVRGIEIFSKENPDLIFTDLSMPKMKGKDFIQKINQLNSNVPIVVVSGVGLASDIIEVMRLGAWDYISKPMSNQYEFD